jgi:hypothetical protein
VCEHDGSVDEVEDVELERVATELDGELQRLQRVLRRERRCSPVADAGELPRGPS